MVSARVALHRAYPGSPKVCNRHHPFDVLAAGKTWRGSRVASAARGSRWTASPTLATAGVGALLRSHAWLICDATRPVRSSRADAGTGQLAAQGAPLRIVARRDNPMRKRVAAPRSPLRLTERGPFGTVLARTSKRDASMSSERPSRVQVPRRLRPSGRCSSGRRPPRACEIGR
jgi:hypothetical protein